MLYHLLSLIASIKNNINSIIHTVDTVMYIQPQKTLYVV
jgi:hypothetical protein